MYICVKQIRFSFKEIHLSLEWAGRKNCDITYIIRTESCFLRSEAKISMAPSDLAWAPIPQLTPIPHSPWLSKSCRLVRPAVVLGLRVELVARVVEGREHPVLGGTDLNT